jgi:uncharacterized protein YkwD
MRMLTARILVATAALLLAAAARADVVDIVNDIRASGCEREKPVAVPVRREPALDAAARLVARGTELGTALDRSEYRASGFQLINIGGAVGDTAIREVLADGFCGAVNNRGYTVAGLYDRGNEFWLVLAAPFTLPNAGDMQATAMRVLELVNEARAAGYRCGRRRFAATKPLTLSAPLTRAAAAHAADMAANGFMGHQGSDGSNAGERVTRAGYRWRSFGENVAAGQKDAETVVQSWLESPEHCANIMSPLFAEMGVAFAPSPHSKLRILWAQVFGTWL